MYLHIWCHNLNFVASTCSSRAEVIRAGCVQKLRQLARPLMPSRRVLCVKVFLAFVFINRAVVARSVVLRAIKCLPHFACSHEIIDLRLLTVHHKTLVVRIINIHSIICKLIEILYVMAGRNRINTILCAVKKSGTNLRSLIYGV